MPSTLLYLNIFIIKYWEENQAARTSLLCYNFMNTATIRRRAEAEGEQESGIEYGCLACTLLGNKRAQRVMVFYCFTPTRLGIKKKKKKTGKSK